MNEEGSKLAFVSSELDENIKDTIYLGYVDLDTGLINYALIKNYKNPRKVFINDQYIWITDFVDEWRTNTNETVVFMNLSENEVNNVNVMDNESMYALISENGKYLVSVNINSDEDTFFIRQYSITDNKVISETQFILDEEEYRVERFIYYSHTDTYVLVISYKSGAIGFYHYNLKEQ